MNYISLSCNLLTYYYIVTVVVNNSKYHKLDKQKAIKKRWMQLRKNKSLFQENKNWEQTVAQGETADREIVQFMTPPNIILMLSCSLLLLANIFMLLFHLPFFLERSSVIDGYIRTFMGLGCFLGWINCVTLLATLKVFEVVATALPGCCIDY